MSNSFTSMPMVYEKNAFSTPFLRGYKLLKIPIVNAAGTPAWPEVFPIARIEDLRQTVGTRSTTKITIASYEDNANMRIAWQITNAIAASE